MAEGRTDSEFVLVFLERTSLQELCICIAVEREFVGFGTKENVLTGVAGVAATGLSCGSFVGWQSMSLPYGG